MDRRRNTFFNKLSEKNTRRWITAVLCVFSALLTYALLILPAIGMAGSVIEKTILTSDGQNYAVSVCLGEDSGIPDGCGLSVAEITDDSEEFGDYLCRASAALDAAGFRYARIFDISIIDPDGNEIQPSGTVEVSIELLDAQTRAGDFTVVHFEGAEEAPVDMKADTEGNTVSFTTESFSAYAIVQGPEPLTSNYHKISSFDELAEHSLTGMYIGHVDGYYFTDGITRINNTRTGITKTKPASGSPPAGAVIYYFETVSAEDHQFRICCVSGGEKKYIVQSSNSLRFGTESEASVITVEPGEEPGVFRFLGSNGYYFNMQGGANGASFAAFTGASDVNAQMNLWYSDPIEEDPFGLDGKSYGLMNWNGSSIAGKAVMTTSRAAGTLDAKAMIVMSNANDNSDKLFAPNDSEIPMWTFRWIGEDVYYITTVADGSTKYLRIDENGASLVSATDDSCKIKAVPGSGIHSGEIAFGCSGTFLTYSGLVENGFSTGGSVGSEWLHLVEFSELTTDYYMTYSAAKVSVSDESITNGSRVIVYTRYWNDEKLRYDFYAISSDGTLVPVYESGDSIEWISGQVNTLLWNFIEYYWDDTTDPNFYYELYNQYSEKYIAPQVTDGQILSDDTIGINLNGRRFGQYYSTILAWDDANYTYAGLKAEDGRLVTCSKNEAMDFYFAIMQDLNVNDDLNTVPTVDHTQYGVTMKIINIDTRDEMSDYLGNNDGGVGTTLHQGLLSTDLGEDGYPTAKMGSLGVLYEGAREVNHLFIGSTYSGSGYFEFDSTQNFAHLNDDNTFTVYKEIGTYDANNRPTLKHGQFFPFNDLAPGVFASVNGKNLTSLYGDLPDTDPRKYEQLYNLEHDGKKADCYFAVDLEAAFTQTPSGLDAWGHDIIFEFTGDDDFWLYVDGELVIDLGGIHSAVPGSVNFRTGEVNVNGRHTTIRDLFYNNYISRGNTASDAQAYVDGLFEQNENGQWVFMDYTNHTMRIFYMERGAGASNLQMHFNLAAVKKGTVQLNKKLLGIDDTESVLAEYPYQIFYRTGEEEGAPEYRLQNAVRDSTTQNTDYVLYKDTINAVKYLRSVTIAGIEYDDVFFLRPDETAVITLPEDATSYRVVECGVRTDIYGRVSVNDEELEGIPIAGSDNRRDFGIGYASAEDRPKVNYVNEIDPDALRTVTIQKQLFREDGITHIEYPDDTTMFQFRLYLASEFDEDLELAYMYTYHVKDPDGYYCMWDPDIKELVRIGDGISDYDELTDEQKVQASFTTSIYGTISNIPADHTIEFRNVLVGTRFRVVERPGEVPDGYTFQRYEYNGEDSGASAEDGITDVVGSEGSAHDPEVITRNIKGWGLRVNKTWSDADYMAGRSDAYFAVFINDGGDLTMIDGTVMQMPYGADPQTLYWYFPHLEEGTEFDQYEILEVALTGDSITAGEDGYVTGYDSVVPVTDGGEIEFTGTPKGENGSFTIPYTAHYGKGTVGDDSNVRIDTVTNSRPGVVFKKTSWDGESPLANAVFTLKDAGGNEIGTFTSDGEGQITIAFLRDGVDYTLTEIKAPQGYRGLEDTMTVTMTEGTVNVTGLGEEYYALEPGTGDTMPTLTIKDRPYTFEAVKLDGGRQTPLEDVTFALHRQVTVDGVITIDLNPMPGYETLTTGADGVIPQLDNTLPPGTYELREDTTPEGYEPLGSYIRFTVNDTGVITLGTHPQGVELSGIIGADGTFEYVLLINNYARRNVSVWKTDTGHNALSGASFALYKAEDYDDDAEACLEGSEPILTGTTGDDGLLTLGQLTTGEYRLVETETPEGFTKASGAIRVTVTVDGVTAVQGTEMSEVALDSDDNEYRRYWVEGQAEGTYQIRVWNSDGYTLPLTGGEGTAAFYAAGVALTLTACAFVLIKHRRA